MISNADVKVALGIIEPLIMLCVGLMLPFGGIIIGLLIVLIADRKKNRQ